MLLIHKAAPFFIPFLVGCSSNYWADRGWDALDMTTVSLNAGLGARARAGPIHAGLIMNLKDYGFFNGAFVDQHVGHCDLCYEIICAVQDYYRPTIIWGREYHNEVKSYVASNAPPYLFITSELDTRYAKYPPPFNPYWTQLEIQASLLFGLRLGMNIGEMLDFLLGFTTIDIYQDDYASYVNNVKAESQANK